MLGRQRMNADIVLGGGGVKANAHLGAVAALAQHGFTFPRAAGTSAGALVAALIAAGVPGDQLFAVMRGMDYRRLRDTTGVARLGLPGRVLSLLFAQGMFEGDELREWIRDTLKRETGAERFGDLRLDDDPGTDLRPNQRYRLVVICADVSRGQLVRLPWDYAQYGLDPDRQLIADAVRASASIPFVFKPVRLKWAAPSSNRSTLVDGGAVSNFPIEIFDRTDRQPPRWPTFGVRLSKQPAPGELLNQVRGTLSLAEAILETAVNGNDQVHLADPCVAARTMFVDTLGVRDMDFDISLATRQRLFDAGRAAAESFLSTWDWERHRRICGQDPGRAARALSARGTDVPGPAG